MLHTAAGTRWPAVGLVVFVLIALAQPLAAAIEVPSNGQDGALNISATTVINLADPAIVTDAPWDAATPGIAAYDSTMWAVVFHYTSVNIAAGATLSFINHPKGAPVVWLVSGAVTVAGTLDIKGKNGTLEGDEAWGGPGGFRGGRRPTPGSTIGAGFGPGGGKISSLGGAGSFGTAGIDGGPTYGTPELVPLIGGSGGSGGTNTGNNGPGPGGGGGGAILIAATGDVTVNGTIDAAGGNYISYYYGSGGSGGAIRIVADRLVGTTAGRLRASGGAGHNLGGAGRICVNVNSFVLFLGQSDPGFAAPTLSAPPQIWPESTAPSARVTEIAGVPVPADPSAFLNYPQQDVLLNTTGDLLVWIETRNVPQASTVSVFVTMSRGNRIVPPIQATFQSGSTALALWTATVPAGSLTTGSYAIQARAALPLQ